MCCDVDPDEVSAVEPDDDEGIEQVETESWNNEQVRGGNVRSSFLARHIYAGFCDPTHAITMTSESIDP
jgi:hypothetical protein